MAVPPTFLTMLITKRKALAILREATGLSIKTCKSVIAKMPQVKDGERDKVNDRQLSQKVLDLTVPPKRPPSDIRPLSERQRAIVLASLNR